MCLSYSHYFPRHLLMLTAREGFLGQVTVGLIPSVRSYLLERAGQGRTVGLLQLAISL